MSLSIDEQEKPLFDQDDSNDVPPSDIVAYNELRSCADLFRMFQQKSLKIDPDFQREIVWKPAAQTRFIDSVIKQLPIPSMCFSLDYKTQKWQVIDGLQRIWTIIKFLSAKDWNLSRLDDIDPRISGQSVDGIEKEDSPLYDLYTRVQNVTLPITVLRCDYSKKSNTDYLFTIFHRLNSGAMKLNNQEIRNCIFSGGLNELLKTLNKNSQWMRVNKMDDVIGYRFAKEEIILRFLAFFYSDKNAYKGQLARFLNDFMRSKRTLTAEEKGQFETLFNRTISIIEPLIAKKKSKKIERLSVTLLEALMHGVAKNLDFLEGNGAASIQERFEKLKAHEELSEAKLSEGLAKVARVAARLGAAQSVFSDS